jgi:outer membrane protein OmpA-like peptidoglycan-associated protein
MAIAVAGLVWSCRPRQIRTPQRPGQDLVVLLPDPDTGDVGRATVSNPSGTVNLAAARESTIVSVNQPPTPVTVMSEADMKRLFGDALAALPPPARSFMLFFRFDSEELTAESRALVPEILRAIRGRPVPDVIAVGHTDTTGTTATNFELGLKRADTVRDLLVEAGLDASAVEVISHGESDLLVPTADEVAEPRNRRVEIAVR